MAGDSLLARNYRHDTEHRPKPWDDDLVVKANTEVSFIAVLNDAFYGRSRPVPELAEGYKLECPLAWEHPRTSHVRDPRQFRVYSQSNSGYCWELHSLLTPVRLWRIRIGSPTLKDAARALLKAYDIRLTEPTSAERFAALRAAAHRKTVATPDGMLEALQVFLGTIPEYAVRQFDPDVLRSVNLLVEEVQGFCTQQHPSLEEARQWLYEMQGRLSEQICR
jgi:hypothetical protein